MRTVRTFDPIIGEVVDTSRHDPTCVGCDHDCPWRNRPMGAPYCQTCDDHGEAIEAGYLPPIVRES